MAMVNDEPFEFLLEKALESIAAVDFLDRAGIAPVTVRHWRNRHSTPSEGTAVSLRFVGDDPRQDDINLNSWETTRELELDIVVDMELDTEISGIDPTGWKKLGRVAAAAAAALQDPASPLRQWCDWVTPGRNDPDEKSTADNGRLVKAATVLYRVRSDDSNVLLAAGENA